MSMVSQLKLVFNQHPFIRCGIFAEDISAERPDIRLLGFKFEVNANGITQKT